jgi:hypothetical protein
MRMESLLRTTKRFLGLSRARPGIIFSKYPVWSTPNVCLCCCRLLGLPAVLGGPVPAAEGGTGEAATARALAAAPEAGVASAGATLGVFAGVGDAMLLLVLVLLALACAMIPESNQGARRVGSSFPLPLRRPCLQAFDWGGGFGKR